MEEGNEREEGYSPENEGEMEISLSADLGIKDNAYFYCFRGKN
jgi:hypothetical protein